MQKKKVKKKKAKKKRAAPKKRKKVTVLSEYQMRAMLEQKRLRVMEEVGTIECTGSIKEAGGETYSFTEAAKVFAKYREAFLNNGLTIFPVARPELQPQMMGIFRQIAVIGYYEITDVDTGYSVIGWGMGCGENEFWSANSAQTRAMKQFLLNAFIASWKDPDEEEQRRIRKACDAMVREELRKLGVQSADTQTEDFWKNQPTKGVENAGSGKGHPNGNSVSRKSASVRGRKKRGSTRG